jgi:hypothetical protein
LNTAALLIQTKRTTEALDLARHLAVLCEDDYRRNPSDPSSRNNVEQSLIVLGKAHLACGNPVAAQHSYDQARAILEAMSRPDAIDLFGLARTYSLLSACPTPGGPPPTAAGKAARQALGDRAVAVLRRAVAADRGSSWWNGWMDPDLDALRTRADFQAVISDWVFPADPFAD